MKHRVIIALVIVLLAGCDAIVPDTASSGGGSSSGLSLSGTWSGVLGSANPSLTSGGNFKDAIAFQFIHNAVGMGTGSPALTGTFVVTSSFTGCYAGGTVVGSVIGTNVTLTVTDAAGATITFTGSATNTSMTGLYSAIMIAGMAGSKCTVTVDSGTWSISR